MDSSEIQDKLYNNLPPKGWGARHTLTLLGFLALTANYAMRLNLAIAVVAMTKAPIPDSLGSNSEFSVLHKDVHIPCAHLITKDLSLKLNDSYNRHNNLNPSSTKDVGSVIDEDTFEWSEVEKGVLLGSFFWGYFITQIPGGILAQIYGGKLLVGIGLGITALLTLCTPFVARWGLVWLISLRVLEGFAEGVVIPSTQVILAKWLPPEERSKLTTFVFSGISIGAAVAMILSGFLIKYFRWPSVFYVMGFLTIIWFILWMRFVHESPSIHPTISLEEFEYLKNSITASDTSSSFSSSKKKKSTPWGKILKSLPVISIYVAATSNAWGLYTLLIEIPTYMKNVLHFDIEENSVLSTLPHLCMFVVATCITSLTDYLIQKKGVSVLTMRKLCNSIAQWGTAIALIGTGFSGCNRLVTVICLNLSVGLIGAGFGGFLVNSIDIASNYVGIIMGIANAFANICGFAAPYVAGLLISENQSVERWSLVFFIAAGFLIFGNLFYVIFAQSDELEWNRQEEEEEEEDEGIKFNAKRRYSTLSLGLPQSN